MHSSSRGALYPGRGLARESDKLKTISCFVRYMLQYRRGLVAPSPPPLEKHALCFFGFDLPGTAYDLRRRRFTARRE